MIPRFLRLVPLLAVLPLAGCLEFAEQTMSYRHDPGSDTLRLHLVYHGIFGGDRPEELSANELEQLDSVLRGGRAFFFANWITELNREQMRQELAALRDPARAAERQAPPEAVQAHAHFLQTLLDNVEIRNGPFYFDARQRLCAVQQIIVRNISRVIAAANAGAPHLLRHLAADEGRPPEERARFRALAQQGGKFIRLEGNRFTVRWPMSRAEFDEHYGETARSDRSRQVLEGFRSAGGQVTFAEDIVTWSLGRQEDRLTRLTLPVSENTYRSNAVAEVRRRAGIQEKLDPDADAQEFLFPRR
jgi:hypothetical protein